MSFFDAAEVIVGGDPPGQKTVGPPFQEAIENPPAPVAMMRVNFLPAAAVGIVIAVTLTVRVRVCMLPLVRLIVYVEPIEVE